MKLSSLNQKLSSRKGRLLSVVVVVSVLALLPSCKTHKVSSSPHHPHTEAIRISHPDKQRKMIVEEAYTWLGTPYKYAHDEKGKGTDCSGMVMRVYETAVGEKIPRNSAKQAEHCEKVNADKVDAGDLIFFATGKDPERVSHVGIVVDSMSFIHASSSKGVVVSKLSSPYFQRTFVMFGRVPRHGKESQNKKNENKDILSSR